MRYWSRIDWRKASNLHRVLTKKSVMRRLAIVQARMGSTRLPGKVLKDVGGRTMLARVVTRVGRSAFGDAVVVATSTTAADAAIVDECVRLGVAVYRGSELDVLDRYHDAAKHFQADVILRVTGDCPFIDPSLIDDLYRAFCDKQSDYVSNCMTRTYPHGLDAEIITSAALTQAWREAYLPYHRAHVTTYIYENPSSFRLLSVTGDCDYSGLRWTVDTAEDLEFARSLYLCMDNRNDFGWRDALNILVAQPDLTRTNQHVRQKLLIEG